MPNRPKRARGLTKWPRVHSPMQLPADKGPEHWMPWHDGRLISLRATFGWRVHDLCLFHQLITGAVAGRDRDLGRWVDESRESMPPPDISGTSDETDANQEWWSVQQARLREILRSGELENLSVAAYADQLYVVGLWALVEQFLGRTLLVSQQPPARGGLGQPPLLPHEYRAPYRWSETIACFRQIGVALPEAKGFAGTNECRVLNNKIKHVGRVDQELVRFKRFHHTAGAELDLVDFDLQYYCNSVYETVGWVMEMVDTRQSCGI